MEVAAAVIGLVATVLGIAVSGGTAGAANAKAKQQYKTQKFQWIIKNMKK